MKLPHFVLPNVLTLYQVNVLFLLSSKWLLDKKQKQKSGWTPNTDTTTLEKSGPEAGRSHNPFLKTLNMNPAMDKLPTKFQEVYIQCGWDWDHGLANHLLKD